MNAKSGASRSSSVVSKSFVEYLRTEFRSRQDWIHPVTGVVFSHAVIHSCLEQYKGMYVRNYVALFCLWMEIPRKDVAENFMISPSTLKRRWEQAVEDLLFLLFFPTLVPEDLKIYEESLY